ncbi:CaiB/BaiF CoA-transferase family protein [Plantactinospora sp. KBS50]|uniref:CaiB/BaiF CoA transferase family protein n=1 Tax=Plantactinospora sp. KBS50 TaxID=2024580 RepID=UPI000BAAE114|nr:CaiB/BaiF CoA-transferase family protein [Plantactinospora sp. KBS50]ASW56614.1 carnitine dehydratase [Plantactinospora sp. KBS50]
MVDAAPVAGPLDGLLVVALEQAVAVPFATRQLIDLGARVIKIERPGAGDFARGYDRSVLGQSSYFVWLNRGKESLSLDVKRPAAQQIVHGLLGRADIFVQNLAPGAAARLGLDARTLAARYPRLIAGDLTGYGSDGPDAGRKAYDLLIQCDTGLARLTGPPGEPLRAGISLADVAGGMYLLTALLSCVTERARTGRGRSFEVSLLDSLAEWLGQPIAYAAGSGQDPPHAGLAHPSISPYGPYPTKDGTVMIAIQNDREWDRLCRCLLGEPDLATDPRLSTNSARVAARAEVDARIRAVTTTLDSAALTARLDAAGIANTRVSSVTEFLSHPQLRERGRWQAVQTPAGQIEALLPPVIFHDGPPPPMPAVPAPGQHTETLLRELGLTGDAIEALRESGTV